jgi:hypothetical protein
MINTSQTVLKILGKLHLVMIDLDYIQKDKVNTFHKYNYASEAAIKDKVHEAFVKHKVLPSVSTSLIETEKPTEVVYQTTPTTEKKKELDKVVTTFRFWCVETGEFIEVDGVGFGQDSGDKGVYKAITGAIKYILTGNFLIPTGDDPEGGDEPKYVPEKATYGTATPLPSAPKPFVPPVFSAPTPSVTKSASKAKPVGGIQKTPPTNIINNPKDLPF